MNLKPFILPLLVVLLTTSCIRDEQYLADSTARLEFSQDTVMFDTVFTTMGTTTHQVRVYNNYDSPLLINSVTLAGGSSSRFRINVDGDTSFVARDVEIAPHDSIFIFVQANINPNDQLTPFLVEDHIVFNFNNRQQDLLLMAYGRNAVYHLPTSRVYSTYINERGAVDTIWYPYSVIDCNGWDHSRPHVIMGYAVVNSNQTLNLTAGDELFFAPDSYLWVYDSATLDARGSLQQPVLFTSLRHDGWYDTLPGQWGYIWFSAGSKNNYMEHALVENSIYGIRVDTNVNSSPTLELHNCKIINNSCTGIIGQGAYIVGDNLLVANCGQNLLCLQYGGRYRFSNSTFANFWRYDSRKYASVVLNNYYTYYNTVYPRDLVEASFRNCIIYGNYTGRYNTGEITFDASDLAAFNYSFDHCLLRTTLIDSADYPSAALIINREPLFVLPRGGDYHLQDGSPAIGAGIWSAITDPSDLDGNPRNNPPSIGAFEY